MKTFLERIDEGFTIPEGYTGPSAETEAWIRGISKSTVKDEPPQAEPVLQLTEEMVVREETTSADGGRTIRFSMFTPVYGE
jgi:hypothetical protein